MNRAPAIVAWGAGVDSTAMIIQLAAPCEPFDMTPFADPRAEQAEIHIVSAVFRRMPRGGTFLPVGATTEIARLRRYRSFRLDPTLRAKSRSLICAEIG